MTRTWTSQLLLSLFALVIVACGDPSLDREIDCSSTAIGENCASEPLNGSLTVQLEGQQAYAEYIVFAQSLERARNLSSLNHSLRLRAEFSSAQPDGQDQAAYEAVQRRQVSSTNPQGGIDDSIRPPVGRMNIGEMPVYVPHPGDYVTKSNNRSIPLYVHNPQATNLSGKQTRALEYQKVAGVFSLLHENQISPTMNDFPRLTQCLQQEIPQVYSILGRPISVNGSPELKVLMTSFPGGQANRTAGLFSPVDRFLTHGGNPLADSNFDQIVYIGPTSDPSRACSTSVHELIHLLAHDYKVLARLPADRRTDRKAALDAGLEGDDYGPEEAIAHVFEDLTGESSHVSAHLYNLWVNPSFATFSLEAAFDNYYSNARSRGLNLLLLYYVLKRAGAELNLNNAALRSTMKAIIQSPNKGYANWAQAIGISEDELMKDFFGQWAMSLYSESHAQAFMPAVIEETDSLGRPARRGLEIMSRASDLSQIDFRPPVVHPHQVRIPLMSGQETVQTPSGGIGIYRVIVPSSLRTGERMTLSITAEGKSFRAHLVRVR
jgi:hypothetical protein